MVDILYRLVLLDALFVSCIPPCACLPSAALELGLYLHATARHTMPLRLVWRCWPPLCHSATLPPSTTYYTTTPSRAYGCYFTRLKCIPIAFALFSRSSPPCLTHGILRPDFNPVSRRLPLVLCTAILASGKFPIQLSHICLPTRNLVVACLAESISPVHRNST